MAAKKRAAHVPQRETVQLVDGKLCIAVIADTHSAPHPRAVELVAAEHPNVILHAGDIGDLGVLDTFAKVAPVLAVRGNIDERAPHLPDALTLDVCERDKSLLTLLLFHIAVYGPKLRADAARLARSEGAGLVVCGHSHVPFAGQDRDLTVFNPGSIGPRRFHLPIVFGVIDVERGRIGVRHVDCETGGRWLP